MEWGGDGTVIGASKGAVGHTNHQDNLRCPGTAGLL